jgi:hypothetical protein
MRCEGDLVDVVPMLLQALASCSMLEWLQVADELSEYDRHQGPLVRSLDAHPSNLRELAHCSCANVIPAIWLR